MSKVKLIYKEVLARVKGDEAGVVAVKNTRKAESAINGQLAALKAKQVDDESAVEDAKEALDNAKYPKTLITDNVSYVAGIKKAYENFQAKEETLADTNDSIEYFEALLEELFADVEGE